MLHYGLEFDYVPSDRAAAGDFAATPYALYVVSDYPAATFGPAAMSHVARARRAGCGLGDARRLGEFLRTAGRIPRLAAGRGLAGGDAAKRRSPQLGPAVSDQQEGRASDSRRAAVGPAARHRRFQCHHAQARRDDVAHVGAVRRALGEREGDGGGCRQNAIHSARRLLRQPPPSPSDPPISIHPRRRVAAVGRRATWPRTRRRAGHRRGPALGRRVCRLGRSPHHARRRRRTRSKSAIGTPASSAICWFGRELWQNCFIGARERTHGFHASRQRDHRTKRRTHQRHQRQPLRHHRGMPRDARRSARRSECGSASRASCRAT